MLLALGLLCLGGAWAGDLGNKLLGDPRITKCSVDQIRVDFDFENDFEGQFFTLDKRDGKKLCVQDSDTTGLPIDDWITVTFNNTVDCPFKQQHVDGKLAYTVEVFMRFWKPEVHNDVVAVGVHTKIDRVFTFACFPNEDSTYESLNLQVVNFTPETIRANFTANPECSYCITDVDPTDDSETEEVCPHDTGPVDFMKKLFHEVHCEPNEHWEGAYCLEVTRCLASDQSFPDITSLDKTNSIEIITEDCSNDLKLISDFDYQGNNTWGFAKSHPFHIGHPDGDPDTDVIVYFYCELRYYASDKNDNCPRDACRSSDRKRRAAGFSGKDSGQVLHVKNHFKFRPSSYNTKVYI